MPFSITLKDSGLQRALQEVSDALEDPTSMFEDIADEIKKEIDKAFNNERSPFGKPWKKHSPVTVRIHGRSKLLQRSGRLRNSIDIDVRDEGIIVTVGADYGASHQFGAPRNKAWGRGKAPIPARPYLPFKDGRPSDQLEKNIEKILEDWIEEKFR